MTKLLLLPLTFASFFSLSQYCITGGPSSTADSNVESVVLNGTSGSISFIGCPGVIGVQQITNQSVSLGAGNSFTISIEFGTCGGNFSGAGQAWIDFNINGVFEPTESILTWTGTPPSPVTNYNFTVPAGATTGASKLRIIQQEAGALPLNPCAAFTWGSVMDFNVSIINGVDCSGYVGDDETNPRLVTSFPFTENHSTAVCYSNQNPVYNSPDVYYLLSPLTGVSSLNISTCGSTFDTFLTVTDATGTPIAINDDSPACGQQSEINISTAGHTSLYVIVEGWNTQSGAYTLNIGQGTLSADELSTDNFELYPNPATNSVTFSGNPTGEVSFVNMHGQVVYSEEIEANATIDLAGFAPGLYIVKLETESSISMQKLRVN